MLDAADRVHQGLPDDVWFGTHLEVADEWRAVQEAAGTWDEARAEVPAGYAPVPMRRVLVTDYAWPSLDIERAILAEAGGELVVAESGADELVELAGA